MDKLSLLEFKYTMKKLLEKVDCPVCFNILHAPVATCFNGHGVCSDCRKVLTICPLCEGEFLLTRNRVLEDILDILPHDCRFKGCGEFVRPGEDHERWCGYHVTVCKYCPWEGFGKNISSHIKTDHKTVGLHGSSNKNWCFNSVNLHTSEYDVFSPVSAHCQFFWMHVTNHPKENKFKVEFTLVPNGKVWESLEVKLGFNNSKSSYSSSTVLTVESLKSPGKDDNIITIDSSTVQSFVSDNNTLSYSLDVNRAGPTDFFELF